MRRISTVFMAGPDLWFPEGPAIIAQKAAMCREAGFEPVVGTGDDLFETERSEVMAREIFARVCQRIRESDALVANLTPFRGPGCDQGVAYAVGFAAALGKPVFAYMNVRSEDEAEARARIEARVGAVRDLHGVWRDDEGCEIEDFGLPENILLWAEARCLYVIVCNDPYDDATGHELCLQTARMYSDD